MDAMICSSQFATRCPLGPKVQMTGFHKSNHVKKEGSCHIIW